MFSKIMLFYNNIITVSQLNIFLDEYSNNLIQHYESYNPLFNDNELKRLIWEEWESEIKEEDPRQMVFKYMKLMRDQFIKE